MLARPPAGARNRHCSIGPAARPWYEICIVESTKPRRLSARQLENHTMAIAKITEISAASSESFEDATRQGIARANETLKNIQGAWIEEQKVKVEGGRITEWRVMMKVTFVLEQ
jgi:flavin-binding protein dodecin